MCEREKERERERGLMENQIFSTKKKRDDIVNSPNQKTIGFNFRKVVRSISGFSDIQGVH